MRKLKLLAAALAIAAGVGLARADLNDATGFTPIRVVFDYVAGRNGKFKIDATNNAFVFGSTTPVSGAVLTSSGTLVVQSISSTAGSKFFRLLNLAGSELLSFTQGGTLTVNGPIAATSYTGDGSQLAGVPATSSTATWTAPQYYANTVNISSPTSGLFVTAASTFTGKVVMSTASVVSASGTTAQATMIVAFTTATITVQGSTVTVAINCPVQSNTTGAAQWAGVMMDGAWLGSQSPTKGLASSGSIGSANEINLTTPPVPFVITPGQHNFALSLANNGGGTLTFPSTHAEACRLIVAEFH
jgi:hypothetical protein